MTRSEKITALETEIKKFLGLDNEIPIDYQTTNCGVIVTSLKKVVGRINIVDFSEIKSKIKQ